jgi:hypothetical protein
MFPVSRPEEKEGGASWEDLLSRSSPGLPLSLIPGDGAGATGAVRRGMPGNDRILGTGNGDLSCEDISSGETRRVIKSPPGFFACSAGIRKRSAAKTKTCAADE